MYYIYMIRCTDNSIYTGITTDIKRRFQEHKNRDSKGAKYTKSREVTAVEALWETQTKVDASRLEYRIKKLAKAQKEKLINRNMEIAGVFSELKDDDYIRITKRKLNELMK